MSRRKVKALRELSYTALYELQMALGALPRCAPAFVFDPSTREQVVRDYQRLRGLTVDGWPGTKTLFSLWQDRKPCLAVDLISRAKRWCEIGTTYALGKGGVSWFDDYPAQEIDCSGFVAACLLRSRAPQADFPRWLATDSIHDDCSGDQRLFVELPRAKPGALVVYPDSRGRQGHVGIVTSIANGSLVGVIAP